MLYWVLCHIFFCCPEPFNASFCKIVYRPLDREKGEQGKQLPADGRDLVKIKLELTPNHQNYHLENTGI